LSIGPLTETILIGNLAIRCAIRKPREVKPTPANRIPRHTWDYPGRNIKLVDAGRWVTNFDEANQFVKRITGRVKTHR
jgi:hypothetical protein